MLKQFTLPDIGEGLVEGDVLAWHVKAGDHVHDGQIVVEVETAKAAVELPCPFDGVVTEIHAEEGATVPVGAPLFSVETADAVPEREPNLVGYGPLAGSPAVRRPRKRASGDVRERPADDAPEGPAADAPVLAKPPVRKLAKDLGVDLSTVHGSGTDGVITRSDVQAAAHSEPTPAPVTARAGERIPVRGVHKHMAAAMAHSAFTAPHASEFLTLDFTPAMQLRDRLAARREFAGVKVSPLLLVAKALLLAVRRHPIVNSSWEEDEIVLHPQVNLGIAAATGRGLVVPNIKAADRLSLPDLARAVTELTGTARAGRTAPADLAGGTISITNVGVFGIDCGIPILPPGEAAILAFGAVRDMPWVVDGQVVPRKVTQLALSFDHRILDGAQASAFLADIGALLGDPALAMAY